MQVSLANITAVKCFRVQILWFRVGAYIVVNGILVGVAVLCGFIMQVNVYYYHALASKLKLSWYASTTDDPSFDNVTAKYGRIPGTKADVGNTKTIVSTGELAVWHS